MASYEQMKNQEVKVHPLFDPKIKWVTPVELNAIQTAVEIERKERHLLKRFDAPISFEPIISTETRGRRGRARIQ